MDTPNSAEKGLKFPIFYMVDWFWALTRGRTLEKRLTFGATAFLFTMLWGSVGSQAASPVIGAEHTRNLRQLDYAPMLLEYHAQTVGEVHPKGIHPWLSKKQSLSLKNTMRHVNINNCFSCFLL